jgi:hypothetical protein
MEKQPSMTIITLSITLEKKTPNYPIYSKTIRCHALPSLNALLARATDRCDTT